VTQRGGEKRSLLSQQKRETGVGKEGRGRGGKEKKQGMEKTSSTGTCKKKRANAKAKAGGNETKRKAARNRGGLWENVMESEKRREQGRLPRAGVVVGGGGRGRRRKRKDDDVEGGCLRAKKSKNITKNGQTGGRKRWGNVPPDYI